ncbi:hypothetical protein [Actinoplanes sp. NPDC023714]|uniref:hypothetical protein n=1 Tax=Actinoplanes sp. NPDC023714 TaxID=3154322 RepID=UPI0033C9B7E3
MKIVGVLGVVLLAVLTGCGGGGGNAGAEAVDRTAAAIARSVDVSLANLSAGDMSAGGISYLTSNITDRRGEVLGSGGESSLEQDALQAWVEARFEMSASGGYLGKTQENAIVCLRFEVHLRYADYTTYDEIDCPA